MIHRIHGIRGELPVAYLASYAMTLACADVDVWLNMPFPLP